MIMTREGKYHTHRGKRYAIVDGYLSEKEAQIRAGVYKKFSPYDATAFKLGRSWAVGIRQWK